MGKRLPPTQQGWLTTLTRMEAEVPVKMKPSGTTAEAQEVYLRKSYRPPGL